MLLAQIQIGGKYYTKVGTELIQVVVIAATTSYSGRTKFECQRADNGRILSKHRSPAALYNSRKEHAKKAAKSARHLMRGFQV